MPERSRRRRWPPAAAAALAIAVVSTEGRGRAGAGAAPRLDWAALARRIVRQLSLQRGERVLLLAAPGQLAELVEPLRAAVQGAGGEARVRAVTSGGAPASLPEFDAVVMLPGASPAHPEYVAAQAALNAGRRSVHFHWRGGAAPSAVAIPGRPLPPDDVIDAVYQDAVLRSDCAALGAAMRRFESALRSGEAQVTTASGTDLRFSVRDRPVNVQDGDASAARARTARVPVDRDVELPCGVLRVAPVEQTVAGLVALPPSRWADREVEGLKLRFERGRVAEVTAVSGADAVEAEMQRGGEAARAFREFALGFNRRLAVPPREPWIPYYGYGAGVVRLSLGDNTELGGAVKGGYVRWNFLTDATVVAGGQVWVRAGVLAVR